MLFDRERVFADEEAGDGVQASEDAAGADPGDAFVRVDLDDGDVLVAFRERAPSWVERMLFLIQEEAACADIRDLHRRLRAARRTRPELTVRTSHDRRGSAFRSRPEKSITEPCTPTTRPGSIRAATIHRSACGMLSKRSRRR